MTCLECGTHSVATAGVCPRCGAPVGETAPDPEAGSPYPAAPYPAAPYPTGPASPGAYVPGRGEDRPPGLRHVLWGYSWMAWGAVFCAWTVAMGGAYFFNLDNTSDNRYLYAAIVPVALAAVLFSRHIRWSWFVRRPGSSATATVCRSDGRALMLDAPWDGYPSGLRVRLPWWAAPEALLPGESVTVYARQPGAGRLLVSSSSRRLAVTGRVRRRPAPVAGGQTAWVIPDQSGGRPAGRRFLQWGPEAIFGAGLIAAVTATLIAYVPPLTGHLATDQLRPGNCLTGSGLGLGGSSPWPYMVAAVPCTGSHLAEVFFAGDAWPKSQTAYPGDQTISDQGWGRCLTAFRGYDGADNSVSEYSIYYIIPFSDDWASGNRWLVCLAYDSTSQNPGGVPVNYSIKGSNQ